MAYLGTLLVLLALWGGWLLWRRKLEGARWFQRAALAAIAFPFLSNFAGWILTEAGRQPWVVYGLLKTEDAVSGTVSAWTVGLSLACSSSLYAVLGGRRLLPDAPLRAARSARGRRRRRGGGAAAGAGATEMTLEILWFCLLCVLLDGLLRARGLRLRRRHAAARPRQERGGPAHDVRVDRAASGTATRSGS